MSVLLACSLGGCDRSGEGSASAPEPERFRSEVLPEAPARIASMAPNITEILFALGAGDEVVAVTRYCDYPAEAATRRSIGGMLDPDYEALLAAEVELVLGVRDGADHRLVGRLEGAGIAYGFLVIDDREGIARGIEEVGRWIGREARGVEVREEFERELTAAGVEVRAALEEAGHSGRKVLVVFDQEPVVAAGPGTFLAEVMELAGLENALGEEFAAYPVLDMEAVFSVNPEIIVDVSLGPSTAAVQGFWGRFEGLDAVAAGRMVHLDDPVMMRPGPRLPEALRALGRAVEGL